MDLIEDLPLFLNEAERMLKLSTEEEKDRATWWIDILFNDQNRLQEEMKTVVLAEARKSFNSAENHVVLLQNGVFKRGWCMAELGYRIQVRPLSQDSWPEAPAGCVIPHFSAS
jgi:hypothetical protein